MDDYFKPNYGVIIELSNIVKSKGVGTTLFIVSAGHCSVRY